ncbi:MAG: autotransporter assembly complex protein TamA [Proteobacteria bacterium]|nr:autotransporter assembly complex protein TamA [Pseudomonadota bacterium]
MKKILFVSLFVIAPLSGRTEIIVEGLSADLESNVIGHLTTLKDLECDAPDWLVRWQFRGSDQTALEALEAFGYYAAYVEPVLTLRGTEACWKAVYRIDAGAQVIIDQVDLQVSGGLADENDLGAPFQDFRALAGQGLNHEVYESAKFLVLEAAQLLGYFSAEVTQQRIDVDPIAGKANVYLHITSGPRAHFGVVEVVNPVLRPELFDAYIPFETGDPFDGRLLERLRRDLISSDYFNRVFIDADRQNLVDGGVPIKIELSPPTRRWAYNFGAGYATDTGFRVRGEAENRLRNDRGHKTSGRVLLSKSLSTVNAQYSIPHKDPKDDLFVFDTGYTNEDNDTVVNDLYRLGARHTYERGWSWIETDFLDLTYENYVLGDQIDTRQLLVMGTTLDYASIKDPPARLQHGHRFGLTLKGASKKLLSQADFLQVRGNAKWIYGLTDRLRVLLRGEAGFTFKNDFDELPPSVRFFAGGDNSIRGYDYKRVGPRDENGDVVGGSRLLVFSGELDYSLTSSWSMAGFVDSGSAFNDSPDFSTGVGLGARWYSPIGPLRVDVAYALDGSNVRLHITLGPDL